jgi:hypothetical protein
MSLLKVVQGVSQSPLLPLGTLVLILQQVMEALGFQPELVDTSLKKKVASVETVMSHYSLL